MVLFSSEMILTFLSKIGIHRFEGRKLKMSEATFGEGRFSVLFFLNFIEFSTHFHPLIF